MRWLPTFTRRFLGDLSDLVFPPLCAACECDLGPEANGEPFCESCGPLVVPPTVYRCPKCATKVAETFRGGDCPWCKSHDLRFDRAVALGSYDAAFREAVLRTKRMKNEAMVAALTDLLWRREADALRAERVDVVLPVPMHWRRRLLRGHNAPEILAELLARQLRIPDRPRGLIRRRSTNPQAGLSVPQRRENVHNAFTVRRRSAVAGKRVLLVDDILTSGATCSEIARVLKRSGAAAVVVAVWARAQGET